MLSGDDQRRNADLVKARQRRRRLDDRAPCGELEVLRAGGEQGGDALARRGALGRQVERIGRRPVLAEAPGVLPDLGGQASAAVEEVLVQGKTADDRADERQREHLLGMGERVVDAQRGAGRRSDEVDPRDAEVPKHRRHVVEFRVRRPGRIRTAEAPPVEADHGVLGGEERCDVVPQRRVHDAVVHEQHGFGLARGVARAKARPLPLGPEPAAGHLDEGLLRRPLRCGDGSARRRGSRCTHRRAE
ncbi:MAG: hypothetical protein MUC67_11535, partial [Acidobacteria bacterium]|nr:hypothetical protein [Acidobacteriota bacterium]